MLAELDLGPIGDAPVAETPVLEANEVEDIVAVGTPTFAYRVQRGTATEQAIMVDAASGSCKVFDGSTYVRIIDGIAYSTADPDSFGSSAPLLHRESRWPLSLR